VENSVEKQASIFVSDSTKDGSAFCTGASADISLLKVPARLARRPHRFISSNA
jgi:hypothetical protein